MHETHLSKNRSRFVGECGEWHPPQFYVEYVFMRFWELNGESNELMQISSATLGLFNYR